LTLFNANVIKKINKNLSIMSSKSETKRLELNSEEFGMLQFFCHFSKGDYKTKDENINDMPASVRTAQRNLTYHPGIHLKLQEAKLLDGSDTLYFAEFSADEKTILEEGVRAVFKKCGISIPATS
jgi:hypothetical protein